MKTAGLNRYLELRDRIGDDLDPLYARWDVGGDQVLEDLASGTELRVKPRFEAVLLPNSYLAVDPVQARFHTKKPGAALS